MGFFDALTKTGLGFISGAYGTYEGAKAEQAMAEYNAKIAENESRFKQMAIEAESKRLTKEQRQLKSKQRMSVSARGGLATGTDLMALAEQAKTMQLDQLELIRQRDIAGIRGASEAQQLRFRGKMAKHTGKWTASQQMLQTGAKIGGMM